MTPTRTAILIVGHGSREARANTSFEAFVASYAAHLAGARATVTHGYVELAHPTVDEALATLAVTHDHVIVVPLFLFLVGHTKNDIPLALARARAAHPHTRFSATRELGLHSALIDIAFDRATAAMAKAGLPAETVAGLPAETVAGQPTETVAVVVGRGSSDPDANGELCKLARLFGEGRGFRWVLPCFIGITQPLLPETLDLVGRLRPRALVVVPYFLFDGRLCDKLRAEVASWHEHYPWIRTTVAAALAPDARLLAVLDQRVAAAGGASALPCDTCQYRAPVAGVANAVGGLRALLWSVRHSFTHAQAAPHPHAHRALTKHVLVCGNADCADRGSLPLIDDLRQRLRQADRLRDIRVTRTSCMGRCGEGPTMAIYPDGIWYRGVTAADAETIVREHLLGNRLVPHLVDNIMQ